MLKKLLPAVLAMGVATVGTTVHASSPVQGAIDFKVTIPEVLVLYHWDSAHLNLTNAVTNGANNDNYREIKDGAPELTAKIVKDGSYEISGTVPPSSGKTTELDSGKLNVTLKNAWAVRALSSDKVSLIAEIQNDTLSKGASSKILVSDIKLTATGANATEATALPVSEKTIGKDTTTEHAKAGLKVASGWKETQGDISFKLDLTKAKENGVYTSGATTATDKTFLLTLTGN